MVRASAVAEPDPDRAEADGARFRPPWTREYMHGAAILDGRSWTSPTFGTHRPILQSVPEISESGYRAQTIMPMMRGNEAIGALTSFASRPDPSRINSSRF